MTYDDYRRALLNSARDLISREQELCDLDSGIGDGDHGITIRKGFSAIKDAVEKEKTGTLSAINMTCAMALSKTSGGAIGPILSSLFMGMMNAEPKSVSFFTSDLADMFDSGLNQVKAIGGAQRGDKTLVDALEPAVAALKAHSSEEPKAAMDSAAKAAFEGAQSTKNMVSKKGRSKNLGERSLGFVDAGSMSMYYFFRAFADGL